MLSVHSITKSLSNHKILNDVNLDIHENEIIGILGPNGAGKTTLMKIICGLIIPDEGNILLDGKSPSMEDINVVFEGNRHFYWPISCLENIYYFASLKGTFKREVDKTLNENTLFSSIRPFLNKTFGELSLGQKQIVSVLTGLISIPKYIFLDEPSNGLDIIYHQDLIEILLAYKNKYHSGIIISSHDLDFLSKIVDRYIVLNHGKILGDYSKEEILNRDLESWYKNLLEG